MRLDAFPLHVTEADNEEMLKLVKALTIQPDDSALREWGARLLEKVAKEDFDDCGEYSGEDIRLIANRLRNGEWKP